ncbi:hypothetical protein PsorP6_007647 [Peronosclerospora sorghi]|uniref:Uncharacterized protein n=1 Tax=Peronosclerospora sorghi TaxID=230839 RepID=A0ACC0W7H1_9STRA|nr:hypothetical protein PsorP6_007647 [Peronosclerospora sorghi]
MNESKGLDDSESSLKSASHRAMRQFDFRSRECARSPTRMNHDRMSYAGLEVKDMITSAYESSASVNIWQVSFGAAIGLMAGVMLIHYNDASSYLVTSNTEYENADVSDQIFFILKDLVPNNIFASFAGTSTLSVIAYAILVGIALMKSVEKEAGVENYPLLIVTHANAVIQLLVNMVVKYIPIAVISLIAGSIASYSSSVVLIRSVAILIATLLVALFTLTVGVFGLAFFVTTKQNIFSHLWHMLPAQVFIFGCSSSIATLPITMRCVDATKQVSYEISRFVMPVGATSNLNGTAIYIPLACIFLAKVGGYDALLTPLRFVLLGCVSTIASAGVAGVPHAALVMVLTVWRTVFGVDVPVVFTILVSIDWILDRLRSVVNITTDSIIVRIIAAQCDKTTIEQLSTEQTEGTELLSHNA